MSPSTCIVPTPRCRTCPVAASAERTYGRSGTSGMAPVVTLRSARRTATSSSRLTVTAAAAATPTPAARRSTSPTRRSALGTRLTHRSPTAITPRSGVTKTERGSSFVVHGRCTWARTSRGHGNICVASPAAVRRAFTRTVSSSSTRAGTGTNSSTRTR